MMAVLLLEPPQVEEHKDEPTESLAGDPVGIGRTTTSLGSCCLRWELVLKSRVRNVPIARVRNVPAACTYRGIE